MSKISQVPHRNLIINKENNNYVLFEFINFGDDLVKNYWSVCKDYKDLLDEIYDFLDDWQINLYDNIRFIGFIH